MSPKIVPHVEQGTDAWFELRRGIPSASNFKRLITDATMKPASEKGLNTYAAELMSQHWRCEESLFKTPYTERGKQLEPKVIEWYEWEMNLEVQSVGFVFDSNDERYGCSPDGLVGDIGGVEIKCPKSENHWSLVFNVTGKDSWQPLFTGGDRVPTGYRSQVFGSLFVTGRNWWDFVCYHPDVLSHTLRVRVYAEDSLYLKWKAAFSPVLEDFIGRMDDLKAKFPLPPHKLEPQKSRVWMSDQEMKKHDAAVALRESKQQRADKTLQSFTPTE